MKKEHGRGFFAVVCSVFANKNFFFNKYLFITYHNIFIFFDKNIFIYNHKERTQRNTKTKQKQRPLHKPYHKIRIPLCNTSVQHGHMFMDSFYEQVSHHRTTA